MSSNPELALCMESVYGKDIDVLSWDFGMTDGSRAHQIAGITLWGYRAKLMSTQPVLFGFTGNNRNRDKHFQDLEKIGMGSVTVNNLDGIRTKLPDSARVNDTQSIPLALRYYICDGHAEPNKEPCSSHKWDTRRFCPKVKGQVGWHPGWKDHMLQGRLLGFYLLQRLKEALNAFLPVSSKRNETNENFQTKIHTVSSSYLLDLRNQEQLEQQHYFTDFTSLPKLNAYSSVTSPEIIQSLFHDPSVCRTALLPSHTRYNNILIDDSTTSSPDQAFYSGIPHFSLPSSSDNQIASVPLVYGPRPQPCANAKIDQDFKDYILVGNSKKSHLTIPNDTEMKVYHHPSQQLQTVNDKASVIFCLVTCEWNRCPKDYIQFRGSFPSENKTSAEIFIHINNEKVVDVSNISGNCHMLQNKNGLNWTFDPKLKLDIEFEVNVPGKYLYISSMVILFR